MISETSSRTNRQGTDTMVQTSAGKLRLTGLKISLSTHCQRQHLVVVKGRVDAILLRSAPIYYTATFSVAHNVEAAGVAAVLTVVVVLVK